MKILIIACVLIVISTVNECMSATTKKTPICNDCNVGPNEGTTQKGPVCKDCEVGPPSEDGNTGDVVVKKPEHGPNCVCVNDVCYNCDVGK